MATEFTLSYPPLTHGLGLNEARTEAMEAQIQAITAQVAAVTAQVTAFKLQARAQAAMQVVSRMCPQASTSTPPAEQRIVTAQTQANTALMRAMEQQSLVATIQADTASLFERWPVRPTPIYAAICPVTSPATPALLPAAPAPAPASFKQLPQPTPMAESACVPPLAPQQAVNALIRKKPSPDVGVVVQMDSDAKMDSVVTKDSEAEGSEAEDETPMSQARHTNSTVKWMRQTSQAVVLLGEKLPVFKHKMGKCVRWQALFKVVNGAKQSQVPWKKRTLTPDTHPFLKHVRKCWCTFPSKAGSKQRKSTQAAWFISIEGVAEYMVHFMNRYNPKQQQQQQQQQQHPKKRKITAPPAQESQADTPYQQRRLLKRNNAVQLQLQFGANRKVIVASLNASLIATGDSIRSVASA